MDKGLALSDILSLVFDKLTTLDMPAKARIFLLSEMSDIE
jgi:hypothetical protein